MHIGQLLIMLYTCFPNAEQLRFGYNDEYSDWQHDFPKACAAFRGHCIPKVLCDEDTVNLMRLLEVDIEENFPLQSSSDQAKPKPSVAITVINDPIYGQIELHPLCCAIIDTPQFQRLRYLMQLGTTLFVFPSASHSRFEHSIGVYHIAGELLKNLRRRQPDLNITDKDELCVRIAGLCHDLGHGPFSHVFGNRFIPRMREDKKWKHEQTSVDMLNHMFRDPANKLISKFREWGLNLEHYKFIREQIHPEDAYCQERDVSASKDDVARKKRQFLYEIVSNPRNGVDVDKWDYIARDCHHLGLTSSFNHNRFMGLIRVIEHNGETQICLRDKEAFNVYEMFHMRHSLHLRVYQHKVCHSIDIMLVEALVKANDAITFPGKDGKRHTIAECIDDMEAFTNLTDNVFHQILLTTGDHEAKSLLRAIQRRELYKCIYESSPLDDNTLSNKTENDIKKDLINLVVPNDNLKLPDTCFYVQIVSLNFGKKDKNNKDANPVLNLCFYKKSDENCCVTLQANEVSYLIPRTQYGEKKVRVFTNFQTTKEQNDLLLKATELFEEKKRKNENVDKLPHDISLPHNSDCGTSSARDS